MSDIRFNRWLHQSGTGGVYQDSSGRVGIGTSVPTSALDVQSGTIKIGSNTLSSSGVSTFSGGIVGNVTGNVNSSGVSTFTSGINVGTGASISSPATNVLTLGTNNVERVRINSSGAVGLGTANPQERLHNSITANNQNYLRLDNPSGTSYYGLNSSGDTEINAATNSNIIFKTFGTERLRIDSSGNLLFNSGYGSAATAYGVRAWVRFNGSGSNSTNQTISGSGNVSTVFKNGTGDYTVNFTNAFVDANYAVTHAAGIQGVNWGIHLRHNSVAPTTSAYRFKNVTPADSDTDAPFANLAFYR